MPFFGGWECVWLGEAVCVSKIHLSVLLWNKSIWAYVLWSARLYEQLLYLELYEYSLWLSPLFWLAAHELQNHNKSINLTEPLYLQWTLTLSGGFEVEGLEAPSKSRWVDDIHSILALTLPVEGDGHGEDDHSDHSRSQTRVQCNINRVLHAWDTAIILL